MKKLVILLLALALMFGIVACGGGGADSDTPGGSSGPGDSPGGQGGTGGSGGQGTTTPGGPPVEISVAYAAIPNSLDPVSEDIAYSVSILDHVYDRLFFIDEEGNWTPAVAKTWKQVDALTWEFEIDLSFVFQNGDQLTMEDVVYSIERLESIPKGLDAFRTLAGVSYEGTLLTVKLAQPNNTAIDRVNYICVIVNKAHIEAGGDDAIYRDILGTGPYVVTEFTPGGSVSLELWDGYPFDKPQIDKINFIAIPEIANRYIAVETGLVDFAGWLSAFEMQFARDDGRFNLRERASTRALMISVNVDKPPLDNINIRRALGHAMDRESVCDLNGGRPMAVSVLFPGFGADYSMKSEYLAEYDMAKARELLEAEGISQSNPLTIEILHYTVDPAIELYQSSLRSLGVNLVATQLEFTVYLQRQADNEYELCWSGFPNVGGVPLTNLVRIDSSAIGTRNYARFADPEVDELCRRVLATTDQRELMNLVKTLNDIASQQGIYIPMFTEGIYAVMHKGLSGVILRADQRQSFRFATFTG